MSWFDFFEFSTLQHNNIRHDAFMSCTYTIEYIIISLLFTTKNRKTFEHRLQVIAGRVKNHQKVSFAPHRHLGEIDFQFGWLSIYAHVSAYENKRLKSLKSFLPQISQTTAIIVGLRWIIDNIHLHIPIHTYQQYVYSFRCFYNKINII